MNTKAEYKLWGKKLFSAAALYGIADDKAKETIFFYLVRYGEEDDEGNYFLMQKDVNDDLSASYSVGYGTEFGEEPSSLRITGVSGYMGADYDKPEIHLIGIDRTTDEEVKIEAYTSEQLYWALQFLQSERHE